MLTIPPGLRGIYAISSVVRYFGLALPVGPDHFFSVYRDIRFVRQGIFRFTNNRMYVDTLSLSRGMVASFASASAIIVAAFSHAYIRSCFYTTKKPDLKFLCPTAPERVMKLSGISPDPEAVVTVLH
ncbi:MAG: hypothetical protein GY758_11410 [Fuerstiella sp.]|nr:hypothetical protein [Fuerstiella sp.]MCP4508474.1 hypothetical protein [Fuerstiella sp.]